MQPDTGNLTTLKFGMPAIMTNVTIDQAHTPHYATGYLFDQVQPRLAMVTHIGYDEELLPELVAGLRVHYKGLFQFGAPDVVVVNVTKDAIWTRRAALPEAAMPCRPSPADAIKLFDLSLTKTDVCFPNPRHTVMDVQEQFVRDQEIDPRKYYPGDVYRKPMSVFPANFKIDVKKMAREQIQKRIEHKIALLKGKGAGRGKDKLVQALGVGKNLVRAVEKAKSPEDFIKIFEQLNAMVKNSNMLGELLKHGEQLKGFLDQAAGLKRILENAKGVGPVRKQLQAVLGTIRSK